MKNLRFITFILSVYLVVCVKLPLLIMLRELSLTFLISVWSVIIGLLLVLFIWLFKGKDNEFSFKFFLSKFLILSAIGLFFYIMKPYLATIPAFLLFPFILEYNFLKAPMGPFEFNNPENKVSNEKKILKFFTKGIEDKTNSYEGKGKGKEKITQSNDKPNHQEVKEKETKKITQNHDKPSSYKRRRFNSPPVASSSTNVRAQDSPTQNNSPQNSPTQNNSYNSIKNRMSISNLLNGNVDNKSLIQMEIKNLATTRNERYLADRWPGLSDSIRKGYLDNNRGNTGEKPLTKFEKQQAEWERLYCNRLSTEETIKSLEQLQNKIQMGWFEKHPRNRDKWSGPVRVSDLNLGHVSGIKPKSNHTPLQLSLIHFFQSKPDINNKGGYTDIQDIIDYMKKNR